MKSYIQDLCGDENAIDIDIAILNCLLQDAVFESLMGKDYNTTPFNRGSSMTSSTLPYPIKYVYGSATID